MAEDVLRTSLITHPIARWHHQFTGAVTGSLVRLRDRLTVALTAAPTGDGVERAASIRSAFTTSLAALDETCPTEIRALAPYEQLDIVSNAAMGFPPSYPAMWYAAAMIEESFFERR